VATPRKLLKRREDDGIARFLTFSCRHKLPFLSNPRIATLAAQRLAATCERFEVRLIAWAFMPDHAHIILIPPSDPERKISQFLESFKKSVASRVLAHWRKLQAPILDRIWNEARGRPQFWEPGGGFDRNVRDEEELSKEIRYVHQNPVKAGLCASATDWPFSSARWWDRWTGGTGEDPIIECAALAAAWKSWRGWRES
jgi:REP element-mobilizing transposase RayT